MNILITGNLASLAGTIVRKFIDEGNKVVLVGSEIEGIQADSKHISTHLINSEDALFSQILSSYHFDTVIFLAPREEHLLLDEKINPGKYLDGLKNVLELSQKDNVARVFFISSSEIYAGSLEKTEESEPNPQTVNGHFLYAAEQLCKMYQQSFGLNVSVLRVPFVYACGEKDTLLYQLLESAQTKNTVAFPANKKVVVDFLHADDVAQFIYNAIDEDYSPELLFVNLASSDQMTFADLQKLLSSHYPKTKFLFDDEGLRMLSTCALNAKKAKQIYNWIAEHELKTEIPFIVKEINKPLSRKSKPLDRIRTEIDQRQRILRWIELFGGAWVMHILNQFTDTLVQFRFVDFRLLFVVLMGSIHGIRFGLLAALLAGISIFYGWYQSGMDWALLLYNVENWLPLALYIIAGSTTGYQRDKKENQIAFHNKQLELMDEKYNVLYGVYADISRIKDQFRDRLLGYRDSYGRIYEITQELDTYRDEDVYLKALSILENLLSNNNVAIYTLDQKSQYARLAVNSKTLNSDISNSLALSDYPEIVKDISKNNVFQNINLLPKYPAYAAPISNNGVNIALVIIWGADFDQYSTYFLNLVKIITGLIQFSLVRATLFQTANMDEQYVSGTKILKTEAFKEILDVKLQMRNNHIADFKIIEVERGRSNWKNLESTIRKGIRSTDYIGLLEDDACYVLLSQANESNFSIIIERLEKLGLKCKDVDESGILYV